MAHEPIHYELFIRRNIQAAWTLALAVEDRAVAIAAAEEALKQSPSVGVKVSKEALKSTGEYQSVIILARGDLSARQKKGRDADEEPLPLCVGPSDLYTVHARERIGRLLEAWLRRKSITAFELLHRPDLVEQLDASGMELQHAIQKIAVPEAQATGQSTHDTIRRFQKLTDAAIARLLGDQRSGLFPDIGETGLAAAMHAAARSSQPTYVLGVAVAGALAAQTSWSAKVDTLLNLLDAAAGDPGRGLLGHVVQQVMSEILGGRAMLEEMLGAPGDLGRQLALMTRLIAPQMVDVLAASHPELAKAIPTVTADTERLAQWLSDPVLEPVRAALARRVLSELHGSRWLHPDDPVREILTLRALARLLIMSPQVMSAELVLEAFTARSHRLASTDFVQPYLDACSGGPMAEVRALIKLAENVVGEANKRTLVGCLKAAIGSVRIGRELRSPSEGPAYKLAHLAELQQSLRHIGLDPDDVVQLSSQLGEMADAVEADAHLIAVVMRSPASFNQRLSILLRLADGEAAPLGPVSLRARSEALKLLRDPANQADLASLDPVELKRARALLPPPEPQEDKSQPGETLPVGPLRSAA